MAPPRQFQAALVNIGARPLLACHSDADGLSAGVILMKALGINRVDAVVRIVGKGENAYSADFNAEIQRRFSSGEITGLLLTDLGVSSALSSAVPTIIVDHHVPTGIPHDATVISGINDEPIPTSSLLAYRCALTVGGAPEELLWLAALGMIGDMADKSGFPEMEAAKRFGITALRKATALINAPRRSASGDATPAFELLAKASGPKQIISGEFPETSLLVAARDEVRMELELYRKAAPKIIGRVALILLSSPCQIHPLIAQTWSRRLNTLVVIAANTGYRSGWIHFAARSSRDVDLPTFLAGVRPTGSDEQYGKGHRAASGGALRRQDWNVFARSLGYGADMEVETGASME
jgi:single-stranded-DNA-specific exonuclease